MLGTGTFIPGNKLTDVPYTVLWEDALASGNYTEDGVLVTFTFTIKEDAELGETPITLSYTQGSTLNYDLDPVAFTVVNGSVEITDRTPGDADGDGEITLRDVIIMRRWLAGGFDVTLDEANADVDGDGVITVADQTLVKRVVEGNKTLDPYAAEAADVNHDGAVDSTDYSILKLALKGKLEIEQNYQPVGRQTEETLTAGSVATDKVQLRSVRPADNSSTDSIVGGNSTADSLSALITVLQTVFARIVELIGSLLASFI